MNPLQKKRKRVWRHGVATLYLCVLVALGATIFQACKRASDEEVRPAHNVSSHHSVNGSNVETVSLPPGFETMVATSGKTSTVDPVLGTSVYEAIGRVISSPTGYIVTATPPQFAWRPTAGYAYSIQLELVSGSGRLQLQTINNQYQMLRTVEVNELSDTKKEIHFNASRLTISEYPCFAVYPTGTITINLRIFQRQITSNPPYQSQPWVNLSNYVHHRQAAGSTDCGPNTYMLARHLCNVSWAVSDNELTTLKNRLNTWSTYQTTQIADINMLSTLASQDITAARRELKATTDRDGFKTWLHDALSAGKPVLMPVRVSGLNIVTSGGTGHFIMIVGIDKTSLWTNSIVYYKNGLNEKSQTFMVNLTDLLDSAKLNSVYNLYNGLSMAPY